MKFFTLIVFSFVCQSSIASEPPAPHQCKNLTYPKKSLGNQVAGKVHFDAIIGASGRVVDYLLIKSSGHKELDSDAISTLFKCKFIPGRYSDGFAPRRSIIEIDYILSN